MALTNIIPDESVLQLKRWFLHDRPREMRGPHERAARAIRPLAVITFGIVAAIFITTVVTHEILRQAEPNPEHRPAIHVG
jgi:hypothetical protein